jgi:hypothetical protein
MTYENIVTKQAYKKGEETKVRWLICGTLKTTEDGKKFIEMNNQPDTTFYVFERKPQEETTEGF